MGTVYTRRKISQGNKALIKGISENALKSQIKQIILLMINGLDFVITSIFYIITLCKKIAAPYVILHIQREIPRSFITLLMLLTNKRYTRAVLAIIVNGFRDIGTSTLVFGDGARF